MNVDNRFWHRYNVIASHNGMANLEDLLLFGRIARLRDWSDRYRVPLPAAVVHVNAVSNH